MLAFLRCFAGGAARWQTVKNPIRSNAYEITARQMWVITLSISSELCENVSGRRRWMS